MNLETLLTRLEPEYLLKLEHKEICYILDLSIGKIFKNKEITGRELGSAQYNIQKSLESIEKRNSIFNYITEVLDKEQDEILFERLMYILVQSSAIDYVQDYLKKVLKSDNLELKIPMF